MMSEMTKKFSSQWRQQLVDVYCVLMVENYIELKEVDMGKESCIFKVWPHDEEPTLPLDVQLDGNVQQGRTMDIFCNSFSNWNQGRIFGRESTPLPSDSTKVASRK
jgi:hypothetical protein